jgi:hypothetical protein
MVEPPTIKYHETMGSTVQPKHKSQINTHRFIILGKLEYFTNLNLAATPLPFPRPMPREQT